MLAELLADLHAQRFAGAFEIVVVEETDAPQPPEGVKYLPHPLLNKGIAYARNMALAHAAHELVAFVDDDCRVGPEWLERLVAPFADAAVLGVQGGVTVPEGTNAIGWAESLLGFPGGGISRIHRANGQLQPTREVSTLNAAYRRTAIIEAGGFAEAARLGGEDDLLAKRVAALGKLLFVPDAVVRHAPRGSLLAIWHWFVRRGRAEIGLLQAGLAPAGYGAFLLRASLTLKVAVALLLFPWLACWPLLLLLMVYVAMSWWRLYPVAAAGMVPMKAWLLAPLVKGVMDFGADCGRLLALPGHRSEAP